MYVPKQFEETRIEVLRSLMEDHPLAALACVGAGELHVNHADLASVRQHQQPPAVRHERDQHIPLQVDGRLGRSQRGAIALARDRQGV